MNEPICTPSTSNRKFELTGTSPPKPIATSDIGTDRLPGARVQRRHRSDEPSPVGVLEVEQLFEVPVKVVGEVRHLLPQGLCRVPDHLGVAGTSSMAARRLCRSGCSSPASPEGPGCTGGV